MESTVRNRRFEFEDSELKFWKKRRYVVAILSLFGFFSSYLVRVNMTIAVVDMTETKNVTLANGTVVRIKEFEWDTKIQGHVLSSFFYGYAGTLLIGGYLGSRFGGKRVFGMGIAMAAALTFMTPWLVRLNLYLFLVVRILEGVFEGIATPCIYEIWSWWAPPLERTRLLAISLSGTFIGVVVGMLLSGYLVNTLGWPIIFYSYGIFGLLWYLIWTLVVAETPHHDPKISREELKYIIESLNSTNSKKRHDIPWRQILTSVPIWALVAATVSENWGFYTFMTQLPKYMKRALKFDLDASGFMSALPYLVLTMTYQVAALTADWLLTKRIFTTTVNYLYVAPKYASILLGLGNTVGAVAGIFSPILSGYIVTNEDSHEQWRVVICIASGVYLSGAVIYGIFGSGEIQPWARDDAPSVIQEQEEKQDLPSTHLTS